MSIFNFQFSTPRVLASPKRRFSTCLQFSNRHPGKSKTHPGSRFWTSQNDGFTLIELLLAIGIAGILLGLTTAGLLGAQRTTSITTAEESLITDIKSQQIKAMNGISGGGNFGIHFGGTNTYTLFQGSPYPGTSTSPVSLDDNITISGSDVIFAKASGEIGTAATITLTNSADSATKTIQMNKYGVITGD